jgi:P27 family predicted phage terminase small subunit
VIKRLQGTFRKDRQNPNEPKLEPLEVAPAPEWLDEYGRQCWEAHVPQLLNNRLLTSLGLFLFAAVCERWSTYRRATDELKTTLTHQTDSNGTCSKPQVAIAKQAFADFRQGLQEFGCTPATCGKVTAAKIEYDDDPAAEFFKAPALVNHGDPASRYFKNPHPRTGARRFLV